MSRGGKREGAGAPSKTPTSTHPVRCTDAGWEWLQSQATAKGHTSVGKWADAYGRQKTAKNKTRNRQKHDWADVDWSMTNNDIARLKNCNPGVVSLARQVAAPQTAYTSVLRKKSQQRWACVDWSQTDVVIAQEMGVSVQAANLQRHKRKGNGMDEGRRTQNSADTTDAL